MSQKNNIRVLETGTEVTIQNTTDGPIYVGFGQQVDEHTGFRSNAGEDLNIRTDDKNDLKFYSPEMIEKSRLLDLLNMSKKELAVVMTGENQTEREIAELICKRINE